jgi:uncharacterized membrane protein YeiH
VLQTILNYFGIAVFAASGSIVAVSKGFDLFGIAALGVLTGVGGGSCATCWHARSRC